LPDCLAALITPCVASGTCTRSTTTNGAIASCYGNGVRAVTMPGPRSDDSTMRVFSSSGALCYTLELRTSGRDPEALFTGPTGALVARAFPNGADEIVFACAASPGVLVPLDPRCEMAFGDPPFGPGDRCTPGFCR
jgi:hypothetical protein